MDKKRAIGRKRGRDEEIEQVKESWKGKGEKQSASSSKVISQITKQKVEAKRGGVKRSLCTRTSSRKFKSPISETICRHYSSCVRTRFSSFFFCRLSGSQCQQLRGRVDNILSSLGRDRHIVNFKGTPDLKVEMRFSHGKG